MELGPHLIFWEINQKCNLRCPYCRRQDYFDMGLSLEASLSVIDSIAKDYRPLLVFSGGEPLLYSHIFEVASYAHKAGLRTALATNGTLIDEDMAGKIKMVDFHRVAVSLDGASQSTNDILRGEGAFAKTILGIKRLRSQGISIQINTTILRSNFKEIFSIYELCLELGIDALHIFAFVPVGCGMNVPEKMRLSPEEYEKCLNDIAHLSLESKIEIKVTCAPHYYRILIKSEPTYFEKRGWSRGCLAGSGVCFISSAGEVRPCGYLTLSAGNIFEDDFGKIWRGSQLFKTLRNTDNLKGKCASCEYIDICSGCRARAYAKTGDYLEEEPDCVYQPLSVKY